MDPEDGLIREPFFTDVGFVRIVTPLRNKFVINEEFREFHSYPKEWAVPRMNKSADYTQLAKYAKPTPILDLSAQRAFRQACGWTFTEFFPHMCGSRVMNLQETLSSMDLNTAPGYLYEQLGDTKLSVLDNNTDIYDFIDRDFGHLASTTPYYSLTKAALKEELRPVEKVLSNSIRVYIAFPMDLTIHGARLFLDMNKKFYDSHLFTASFVGGSPFHGVWNLLIRKLEHFPKVYRDWETYRKSVV